MRFILEESMVLILELSHDRKEEPYDSTQTCYVLCAYKRLLKSNIIALADNAKLLVDQQNNYKL